MRDGASIRLHRTIHTAEDGTESIVLQHTLVPVFAEMLLQICRDYPGLPDVRDLSIEEILFFYEGLRSELMKATKPEKKKR